MSKFFQKISYCLWYNIAQICIFKLGKKQPHWRNVVAEELYDHFEDPEEIDNTYQSPKYAHIKRNLRRRLKMQFT